MSKRMSDTEIWTKDWYLDLSIKQKLLVKFLFDNCDCAGIYEISYRTLRNCFNEEIKKEDFEGIKQIKFISDNKIFIEDFIQFQYGISIDQLNEKNNVHKGIIKSLSKNGIFPTLNQPLSNPCLRVLDKDMDKDKDKEEIINNTNPDFYFSDSKQKVFDIYKQTCTNLIALSFEPRNKRVLDKVNSYLNEINNDFEQYKLLCEKANHLQKIAETKIDFEMMLNCYIGIMNGKYEQKPANRRGVSPETIKRCIAEARAKQQKELSSG